MFAAVRQLLISGSAVALLCGFANGAVNIPRSNTSRSAVEQRLLVDARDGVLDEHSLTRAALIAGGLHDARELSRLEERINQLAAELGSSVLFAGEPAEKARVLHNFLHVHVLHHYDAGATDLRRTLDTGVFNCVTGAIVYLTVGRRCGLDLIAQQSRGHVRCVLRTANEELTIETTQATWGVPASSSPERRLRPTQLLAMFYFNRAHELHAAERFDEAVAALLTARELDPMCPEVQENLRATLNNWALACEAAGDSVGAEQIRRSAGQLQSEHR